MKSALLAMTSAYTKKFLNIFFLRTNWMPLRYCYVIKALADTAKGLLPLRFCIFHIICVKEKRISFLGRLLSSYHRKKSAI